MEMNLNVPLPLDKLFIRPMNDSGSSNTLCRWMNGQQLMTNLTSGDKVVLYFQPYGWFGAGRYEDDGYVYNAAEEPKILMTDKWNEALSFQPCDMEGEPLPGTELKEVWRVATTPEKDKFQYTHFAHKINSFETAPKNLLASDSRLRPDRCALEKGDVSKSGAEKSRLEERQRAEKKCRDEKGEKFTPQWFRLTKITPTPWGELEVYEYNGKYSQHRAAFDGLDSIDVKSVEFNPWQYGGEIINPIEEEKSLPTGHSLCEVNEAKSEESCVSSLVIEGEANGMEVQSAKTLRKGGAKSRTKRLKGSVIQDQVDGDGALRRSSRSSRR